MENHTISEKPELYFGLLSPDAIEVIRPLWEQLTRHHATLPGPFGQQIASRTFDTRVRQLREKAASGGLRIEVARQGPDSPPVAYCITSLSADGTGELDSLFVAPALRRAGLATELVRRALEWLDESGAVSRRVTVLQSNEDTLAFYRRIGFHPRNVELEQPPGPPP